MLRLLAAGAVAALPAAAHAEGGMPQLDFGNPLTISQIVWGAIIFFALYLLLAKSALPQVGQVLESRAARIEADLDTARTAKAEADSAAAASDAADRKARADAQAQVASALASAKAEAAVQAQEADQRLNAQLAESEGRINQARASAMGALRQVATDTAASVVTRLTGQAPDAAILDRAVGDALAARGAA